MTLWIVLTIMTSAAAVLVSAPFIRRFDRRHAESAGDIEVYRDQLKEVESELRQGLIDDAQAEMARVEIKRRALAADRMERPALPKLSQDERNFAVICVTGIVVLGSVGLYAATGNPDLPSMRGSGAMPRETSAFARETSTLESISAAIQSPADENQRQPRLQTGLPPVDEMIRRLAARLLQNPNDVEGWRTLGWSYASIGHFSEAGEAYAKAIELSPGAAEIRSARVEVLVKSADGMVTADARNAIEETLRVDPKDARARFFKGLAKEQDGDKTSALADWTELLKDVKADEPWVPDLKNRISELERDMGVDAARPAAPKPGTAGGLLEALRAPRGPQMSRPIEKGPSPQDVQAAETMAPADRSAMIRGMVDGLASRLEQSPRDPDGWIKLIRSRVVLGETELAKRALWRGLDVFADDKQQRDRIAAAAQQLGLSPQ
ncbi:MAG TPA: c-type cytochrome biogenesis protein CcmI [Xanthobacteraceae bacterium]|nr:c-type cytochrome biogenesis protein CcmI [Xanthobacteraceae bacterium]